MADFNALEALINAHIKKNGVQAITGNILNGILRGMVSALGKGYTIAGVAVPSSDPGTMTGPLAYLAYTAGTYTHFGGLEVGQGEVAMLIYNEAVWHKEVLFSLAASATIDGNVGTPEVGVSFVDGLLTFDFRNMKGNPGDAAGFGTINATVDGNVGTPGVSVQSSGPDTAKNITFQFTNLKGETGVTSVVATVDNTVGTPTCTVSLVGQQLTLAFSGLKGAQGDTGVSADYPIAIVNNLTTNDPTQALSAAMGVQLEAEVSQLEAKVTDLQDGETVLQQQIDAIQPVVIEGNVTNAPDNEDITATPDNRLKFADRSATLTNKGYKILRAGKTFAEQVTDINTIYEIRYPFDLDGDEFTMPAGCTLSFHGGNIGNGVLICNGTTIVLDYAGFKNIEIKGTITNTSIKTDWFDVSSYTNDWDFLHKYFAVGQSDEMNGLVYDMTGEYKIDLDDYDGGYPNTSFLGKFFTISHSLVIRGRNAAIRIVKNGVSISVADAATGICRGIFGILPVVSGIVIDISGLTLDGGVSEEFGQVTTNAQINLNRNLISVRRDFSLYIDGRQCGGNVKRGNIYNCVFEHCYCESLIFFDGAFAIPDKFVCKDSIFRNGAGAAYNVSGASLLENCYFEHLSSGGAIETTLLGYAGTIIRGCKFVNVQTICSILDGYNENALTDSLGRTFVFENNICKNTSEFNALIRQTPNANIYGVAITNIMVCSVLGSSFDGFGEYSIFVHTEVNSVTQRRGISSLVYIESCTFQNGYVRISNDYAFHLTKCVSYGQSLVRKPPTGNASVLLDNCQYVYEFTGADASKALHLPNFAYIQVRYEAKDDTGLDGFGIRIRKQDNTNLFTVTPSDPTATSALEETKMILIRGELNLVEPTKIYNATIIPYSTTKETTTAVVRVKIGVYQEAFATNGTTAQRPTSAPRGFTYYDSTLGRPVFANSGADGVVTEWIDPTRTKEASTIPSGGILPNVFYNLGVKTGAFSVALATPVDNTIVNHYYLAFDTGASAPTITWPSGLSWDGGAEPVLDSNKHYEVSILNGVAMYMEV